MIITLMFSAPMQVWWRRENTTTDCLRTLPNSEYLTGLRETHSWHRREASKDEAIVGDVVILKDDTTKRVFWKLAVIEEL